MKAHSFILSLSLAGCSALGLPIAGGPPGDVGTTTSGDGGVAHDGGGVAHGDLAMSGPDLASGGFDLGLPAPDLAGADMAPSAARCLTGGSVVYLDGDPGDWVHPGAETIQVPSWSWLGGDDANTFWYEADVSNAEWWSFAFSSVKLGAALAVGRYDGATRYPFEVDGAPGLDVTGSGRGCNVSSGWFEIESIARDSQGYTELTATFEQHCENGTPALRGCIHFER